MYANLYYAFRDLFGVELPGLRFINSFGFFVAIAFLLAAFVLSQELKRRQRLGLLQAEETKIIVGKPATASELFLNFLLGFLFGYKIIGLFLSGPEASADPQQYIFSGQGNWLAGIALGLLFAGLKWNEKNRQKLARPEESTIRIGPHDRVGDLVVYAAIFGFLGAKLFHNFENWEEFQANPVEALLSFSGLTFYGGLICAGIAIYYYSRKHRIGFRHLCDAMGPALILAYAIGRIGCQVSGDGDWGILNSAYVTTPDAKVRLATDTSEFHKSLQQHSAYYTSNFRTTDLNTIPHAAVKAPSWLPDWMFAYNFPNNVIGEGVPIENCSGQYCNQLPGPVFPTAFYETLMGLLLFGILWAIRSRMTVPGTLFAVYLVLNGMERFLIEKIRVNNKYDILGFHPTQAEIISSILVLTGVLLYVYFNSARFKTRPKTK